MKHKTAAADFGQGIKICPDIVLDITLIRGYGIGQIDRLTVLHAGDTLLEGLTVLRGSYIHPDPAHHLTGVSGLGYKFTVLVDTADISIFDCTGACLRALFPFSGRTAGCCGRKQRGKNIQ